MFTILYVYNTICLQYYMFTILYVYNTICLQYYILINFSPTHLLSLINLSLFKSYLKS